MDTSNRPWKGKSKIVVGIDIGTTDSGVSFAYLQNGYDLTLHRVTQWPGQEAQQQRGRVPSLVWYNGEKKAASFGAKALSPQVEEEAEDNGWILATYFPLHLCPDDLKVKRDLRLDPLPPGIPLQQIYSDFLRYLLQHTKTYFEDHMLDGKKLWAQFKPTMEVAITCPYKGSQQQELLRSAVAAAGFVDGDTSRQILFVAESEAMVHFLYRQTGTSSLFQPTRKFVICDAGESVVKMTVLSIITTEPTLKLKEHSSAFLQTGGIVVDVAAEDYLRKALASAGLHDEDLSDFTNQGVRHFSDYVKRSFHDASANCMIEMAGPRFNNTFIFNNTPIKIRRGRMELPGAIVQSFFDSCVTEICATLNNLLQASAVLDIIITGEFGGSPILQKMIKGKFEPKGYQVFLTNDSYNAYNATTDGAVIWGATDHSCGRALRFSYGFVVSTMFDPEADEHQGRETYVSSRGYEKVIGAWSQLANKGDMFDQDRVTRVPYNRMFTSSNADLYTFRADLFAYTEEGKPSFARDQQGKLLDGFRKICTMTADLSNLRGGLQEVGAPGESYWSLTYDLCLRFGGVELGASIEWQEQGATRIGLVNVKPVDIVYLD
ncbi:hypothetical protein BDV93DRAFT_547548 [Ceratobasidium sp. AG-I]|nr:hypothetical protein BDV93DRAFT_547548 [Ceratobasidium sp. AG-I]